MKGGFRNARQESAPAQGAREGAFGKVFLTGVGLLPLTVTSCRAGARLCQGEAACASLPGGPGQLTSGAPWNPHEQSSAREAPGSPGAVAGAPAGRAAGAVAATSPAFGHAEAVCPLPSPAASGEVCHTAEVPRHRGGTRRGSLPERGVCTGNRPVLRGEATPGSSVRSQRPCVWP